MNSYLFYLEGLDRRVSIVANNPGDARQIAWDQLTKAEQGRTIAIRLLDTQEKDDDTRI